MARSHTEDQSQFGTGQNFRTLNIGKKTTVVHLIWYQSLNAQRNVTLLQRVAVLDIKIKLHRAIPTKHCRFYLCKEELTCVCLSGWHSADDTASVWAMGQLWHRGDQQQRQSNLHHSQEQTAGPGSLPCEDGCQVRSMRALLMRVLSVISSNHLLSVFLNFKNNNSLLFMSGAIRPVQRPIWLCCHGEWSVWSSALMGLLLLVCPSCAVTPKSDLEQWMWSGNYRGCLTNH